MFLKPILLFSIFVGAVTVSGELYALQITLEDRGIVFVHVVHCFGHPLEGAEIHLSRKGEDGKSEDTKKFSTYTLKDIP